MRWDLLKQSARIEEGTFLDRARSSAKSHVVEDAHAHNQLFLDRTLYEPLYEESAGGGVL